MKKSVYNRIFMFFQETDAMKSVIEKAFRLSTRTINEFNNPDKGEYFFFCIHSSIIKKF